MQDLINEIAAHIKNEIGAHTIYPERPIYAKVWSFQAPFKVFGISVSPENKVAVMDGSCQWYELEDRPEDERIINKLHRYFHLHQQQSLNHQ